MPYPPELKLTETVESAIKNKLIFDITNHRAERSQWIDSLRELQRDYWAEPSPQKAKFPFDGASNIIIPLTAIVSEAIHARIMQRLFSLDHFVSCKFNDPFWSQFDRPIERCLDWQMLDQMKLRERIEPAILEIIKYGTGVIKDGYQRVVKNVDVDGEIIEFPQYSGPWFEAVPLSNFLMPFTSQDPQTADWCGEEHASNPYQVLLFEKSGLFRPGSYTALADHYGSLNATNLSSTSYRQETEELERQVPAWPLYVGWYEIYTAVAYDENDDTKKKEVVILYHYDSNTILSVRDNTNEGRRPYDIGNYITVEHRWAGIGVAKQMRQFQVEVTVQHRQRLDAGALANANMLKVKKLSGFTPDEPVFPGKMWFVDEMEDVQTFQLGGTYPAASNNEQQTLYYAQQRSGINELTLGMPQTGTPGTATSDMARVQESGFRFDYTYNNIRTLLSKLIVNTVCNIHNYGLSDERYYSVIPEGQALKEFFALPVSLHRSGIICKFEAVGQSANKVLDRNNWMQLTQIFQQYYQNALGVAQMMQRPDLMMAIGLQSINASTIAFRQILESYDLPNPDKLTLRGLIDGLIPNARPQGGGAGFTGGSTPAFPQGAIPVSPPVNPENAGAVPPAVG